MITEGTVIQDTMRAEDLLPAFFRALEEVAPMMAYTRKSGTYAEEIGHAIRGTLESYLGGETDETITLSNGVAYPVDSREDRAQYVWEAIEAIAGDLSANAPEGMYFGSHPGDGSDYGFWACEEGDVFALEFSEEDNKEDF